MKTNKQKLNIIPTSIWLVSIVVSIFINSCITNKNLTYLQYFDKPDGQDIRDYGVGVHVTPSDYRIMPYDNLFIRVMTPDPQWSTIFNLSLGQMNLTQESASLSGYAVDIEGNIEIPYVGKMRVTGKTLNEIKNELDITLKNYIADASITVRLVNNYVSIIGEVRVPGRYLLTKDRVNIFEAISLAGDAGEFSNRQKVQLIRPTQYGPIIKELSLLDRSIMTSEYYYVMPNDIIYLQAMKGRSFRMNSPVFSTVLTSVSTILLIFSFFRPN